MNDLAPLRRRGLLVPVIFFLGASAVLVSLGVWQLHRLKWKETLIAEIMARSKAPPQPVPEPSKWPTLTANHYAYRHVELSGTFDNNKETFVFYGAGPHDWGPGYLVMTPFELASGAVIIVNRGFVPVSLTSKATRAQGEIGGETHISGLMRPPESRTLFTPHDEPDKGIFYTRDPGAIATHLGLANAAPFIVDVDDLPVPGGWPKGGMTEINIPNNHLDYAITWFGLAGGLFAVFVAFLLRYREEGKALAETSAGPKQ